MAKCEQLENTGECYPGIDQFDPVSFTGKFDDGTDSYADTVPYCWSLRWKPDTDHAGDVDEYYVCEDCHNLCKQRLANQEQ